MGTVPASSVEAAAIPPARPPPSLENPCENPWGAFVSFGAALSAILGLLGLAGWWLDMPILKSGLPGLVPIKANSAICLILLGVSLWLLRTKEDEQRPARMLTAQLLAGLAAAIGLLSLVEYLYGVDLDIDQLLFVDTPIEAVRSVGLGLMAPVNALNYFFLGLALILMSWTTFHRIWPSQVLSFAAGLISLFNLLDFILRSGDLHTFTALPSAAALTVLSPAVMCARPQLGYGASPRGSNAQESILRRWFFQGFTEQYTQPLRYGGAVVMVTVAAMVRQALGRSLGELPAFFAFYPATLVAAVLGGWGPGLLATALSAALATYFFIDWSGAGPGKVSDMVVLVFFSVTGLGISGLAETLERTRRRSTETARKTSLYARSLIEAGLDPLMTINMAGKLMDVNHAAEEATGVTRSNLIGTDFASYFAEPDKARLCYRDAFDHGQVQDCPLALRHVSGEVMDVLYHARLYRDESGAVAGVCGVARDVTERKRVEQELAVSLQHLEDLVADRTAEIQNSNRKLEGANQELETFAYSVSHDLRTPLRAVDGFSRILVEEYAPKLDVEGQRIVGVVREGTRKMARMIDDILAFSRAGRQEIAAAAIDMEKSLWTALKDLEPAVAGRNLKLDFKPLPASYGDAPMILRVWTNLLDNAIKFTRPQPHGLIEVGALPGENETVYYVKDNGAGFDPRYIHKLFGVFQRLHGQEEFPGTGIGLAIVKRIVARHGGRVWAEGKVGYGATIYFALPAGDEL